MVFHSSTISYEFDFTIKPQGLAYIDITRITVPEIKRYNRFKLSLEIFPWIEEGIDPSGRKPIIH